MKYLVTKNQSLIQGKGLLLLALSILVVIGGTFAITATYGRLSQTTDENNHIAAGMEWLQDGTYLMWTENPPLARAAVALGPYRDGSRLPERDEPTALRTSDGVEANCGIASGLGNYLLYETGESYRRNLALARAGTLPFYLLLAAVLWFWPGKAAGERKEIRSLIGFVAVAAACTLPAVLAHSGLATTDVAFVAVFMLFLLALVRWLEKSTLVRTAALGLTLGLAVATKFTALVFVPAAALALVAARMASERRSDRINWGIWGRRLILAVLLAAPLGFLVLWGAYRFSIGTLDDLPHHLCGWFVTGSGAEGFRGTIANAIADKSIPMPEFFHGVFVLLAHNEAGHWAYTLGEVSKHGFWYFYPLALAVKTPLPFIIFTLAGLVAALRRARCVAWWVWGAFGAAGLILFSLTNSQVNIGLRHAIAAYPLLALGAAGALVQVLPTLNSFRRRWTALGLGLLFAWQIGILAAAHPDYLSYFNPIAGKDPGAVLVDSDLDWGQGVFELEAFFQEHDTRSVNIVYFGSTRLCDFDLPRLRALSIGKRVHGWVVVSEFYYREAASFLMIDPCGATHWMDEPGQGWFTWLQDYEPVAILNGSLRVYYIE